MSKKKQRSVKRQIRKVYEQAKSEFILGASDSLDEYLGMTLETFDDVYPMFKDEDNDAKERIIAKVKSDIIACMMLSLATQAVYVGQYKAGENDEPYDAFDRAGLASYYATLKEMSVIGGE